MFNLLVSSTSAYAQINVAASTEVNYDEPSTKDYYKADEPSVIVLSDTEDEKIFRLSNSEYEYHEEYVLENGQAITKTTTYLLHSDGQKEFVDYYERLSDEPINLDAEFEIQPMCGPPCGYIAVIAVRQVISGAIRYHLKRTATSATIKTITKAPPSRINGVIANYTPHTFNAGGRTYTVTRANMKHYLERHHVNYWNGTDKYPIAQSFFVDSMSPRILNHIATQAVQRNAVTINNSVDKFVQVNYTYNGIVYRVGVNKNLREVSQIYPRTTYTAAP